MMDERNMLADELVTLRAQLAAEQARAERAETLLRRVRETYNHLGAPVTMTLQNDIDAALAATPAPAAESAGVTK